MVSFSHIPSTVRVPIFYAEMDNSQANYGQGAHRRLLLGQKLAAGTAPVGTPQIVSSTAQAKALFGVGSMLARMHEFFRKVDPTGEIWCIPMADDPAGAAATGTLTVTGTATEPGTISEYVAAQRVQVGVALGDTAATIATSIASAVNASADLPVTAAAAGGVVTFTCKWKGATGNDITLLHNFRGEAGGEVLPAGITLAYVAMHGGTANPSLSTAIVAMGDEEYDFIANPYSDSANLDLMEIEMGEDSGRWSWARLIFGHAYTALRGNLSSLSTFGQTRNDNHHTIAEIDVDCPHPAWEYAASYTARNAVFLDADISRPTQSGALTGLLPPRAGKRFSFTERQSLLNYGIATSRVEGNVLRIDRAITTYQKNAYGQDDASYLDSEDLHKSAYVLRDLRSIVTSKYGRHALADDGTRFDPSLAVVTPSVIRGELVTRYAELEFKGIVENATEFKKHLVVQRNPDNPNRLDVLYPPDYVNALRVFAVLNQFRLQYSAETA